MINVDPSFRQSKKLVKTVEKGGLARNLRVDLKKKINNKALRLLTFFP